MGAVDARDDAVIRRVAVGFGLAVGLAVAHVALAWLASRFAVLGPLTVWYAPAGLALGTGTLLRWRALPGHALGELAAGLLVFGLGDELGWLVVPEALAYASVYVGAGVLMRAAGAATVHTDRRRPATILLLGAFVAPLAGALVGVGFRLAAGAAGAEAAVGTQLLVWYLGDAVGIAAVSLTVVLFTIRIRRGGRWWALPDTSTVVSLLLVSSPAGLALLLGAVDGRVVPFAAAVCVPFMAIAALRGLPAVAMSAPLTTLATTLLADATFRTDVLAVTDLQVLLLALIATGLGIGLLTEQRNDLVRRTTEQTRHLELAQASVRAGSFVWDVHDDDLVWSAGMRTLFGVDTDPVTADDLLARLHPDDRRRARGAIARVVVDREPLVETYRAAHVDGTELVVRVTMEARTFDRRVVEVLGTCRDVTAEELARQQLEAAVDRETSARMAEEVARHEAERVRGIKEALLISVSHEVRTPLTLIGGLIETLRREELRDTSLADNHAALASLWRHNRRLNAVLSDLLDVDRIGRGIVEPVRRPCDLRELCEAVVASLELSRSVTIDVPAGDVWIDSRLVSRIVEHLLRNVERHTPPRTAVRVAAALEGEHLHLQVVDGGPGIDPTERQRLLQAFEQGDVPAHAPGTGVGLFIVARFAELHGGRAWVDDTHDGGGGARIHVLLATDTVAAPVPAATDGDLRSA